MRDSSGRRRDVTRFSPIKLNTQGRALPDRTGQRALDAVLSAAADIRVDLDDTLSDSITVLELWKHYRDHLISLNRVSSTISRYDEAAKTFDTAFGGRRLSKSRPLPSKPSYKKSATPEDRRTCEPPATCSRVCSGSRAAELPSRSTRFERPRWPRTSKPRDAPAQAI
ncbi:hypothetical protein [Nocardia sp. MW-W600-9]